ncbi:MAG: Flp family type IVb pilin [Actinomycetes bacterium]
MLQQQIEFVSAHLAERFHADEKGAVTIEYGVITVFIALALIAVVGVLVGGVGEWFGNIADFISGQPGG